jgi:hypothetical protein
MRSDEPVRIVSLDPRLKAGRLIIEEVRLYEERVVFRVDWAERPWLDVDVGERAKAMLELRGVPSS